MAFESTRQSLGTEVAAADLSAKQYYAVVFGASGVALAGDGLAVDGILQNTPASGEVCEVTFGGVSKAVAGAAITKGAAVASDANGKLITAVSGDYIVGRALRAAGAANEIIPVLLSSQGTLPA